MVLKEPPVVDWASFIRAAGKGRVQVAFEAGLGLGTAGVRLDWDYHNIGRMSS
jgi:hypothetical protein